MGADQFQGSAPPQGIDDKHMSRGRTGFDGCLFRAMLKLFQGLGKTVRIAVDFSPFPVGQIFPRAGFDRVWKRVISP